MNWQPGSGGLTFAPMGSLRNVHLPLLDGRSAATERSFEAGPVPASWREADRQLRLDLLGLDELVVAFSGGVDSTYLLAVAVEVLGDRVLAVTADSASLAAHERREVVELAAVLRARHEFVVTDELERPAYVRNDAQRCFHCKEALFDAIDGLAASGRTVALGTIVDDLDEPRPGNRSAASRGVLAPLAAAGFTKAHVRAAAASRGLSNAEKPAMPCLSSRVAPGIPVDAARLERIDRAETWLRDAGFWPARVRDHGELARVEVPLDPLARLSAAAHDLDAALRALGWRWVAIDAAGLRSGSLTMMNAQ